MRTSPSALDRLAAGACRRLAAACGSRARPACCAVRARCGWRPTRTLVVGRPAPREGLGLRRARPDAAALRHRARPCAGWRPRSRRCSRRRWSCWATPSTTRSRRTGWRADDADALRRPRRRAATWSGWSATTTADGPRGLPGEAADETAARRPDPAPRAAGRASQPGEVAGHLHPLRKVAATGGGVRRRCFVTDGERLILPAFGAYAGGLNVRDAAFAGLFGGPPLAAALGARPGACAGVGDAAVGACSGRGFKAHICQSGRKRCPVGERESSVPAPETSRPVTRTLSVTGCAVPGRILETGVPQVDEEDVSARELAEGSAVPTRAGPVDWPPSPGSP